ncbi:efflux RND transporter periplasmic adaptor subunit [uncultured Hydrogenophaga sp.]|uniref:efflux RND transporter periplasmic adaptor subunit n=1 Tax=uncultured Hydrogenophaga sp. TaxID=199683 RepID=UPI00265DF721|nr:efflux RND transporter periplasmic adaptor subunit [uncultured Hydrogenophaga sp.]
MKRPLSRSAKIQIGLLVLLILAVAFGVVRALDRRATQAKSASAAAQSLQTVPTYQLGPRDVLQVVQADLEVTVPVSGTLEAVQTVAIKARVAGELQGLRLREGDAVKAGDEVARIDSTEALARVRQAEQQAASAQAQAAIARRNQDNNQALVKQGFISPTALDTSTANLDAAEANHRAALAALDIARKGLADTRLRSPITGLVSARPVQDGERVGVDARVLEVVDLSAFEVEVTVAPSAAAPLKAGQTALLRIEGLPEPVKATVARINPSVQAGSRSVLVYLRVPSVQGMRQGLFAQGHVVTGKTQVAAVPLSSVRNDKPQPYVQVVREGAVVHQTLPEGLTGLLEREPMRATPELAPGTPVLSVTAGLIREGTPVRLPQP